MVNVIADKNLYQCEVCGFHYREKKTAEKCEAWCRAHHTCNIEITKEAVENEADGKQQ